MVKILVLYHSVHGHTELMAYAVADGACRAGVDAEVKRAPELVAQEVTRAAGHRLDQPAPLADPAELQDYDAIIIGTGARHGRMGSQMASFLERAGQQWPRGALRGKVGGGFVSSASQHGGHETTLLTIITNLLDFGMIVVGMDYGYAGQLSLSAPEGGSPYGAGTLTGLDGTRQPSQVELDGARYQGRRIAETTLALHGA
ncbi:NAD(P)H:quinone oxidoreductase [uncultured Ramlibacter sp.]|uniref:NAD(P)H:quinone oxidoreductase n=1 Tax=uncultured Ramlibacter sp. TaxID=260755 RepID=UPI00261EAA85|nr:NAD(P)H:quinone oxidoreductase [uncultured Ramlibacter sp.]